jgi:hypothetical protein
MPPTPPAYDLSIHHRTLNHHRAQDSMSFELRSTNSLRDR